MNIRPLYEFDEFLLDSHKRLVYRGDEVIHLPPKAVELLLILVENNGEVLEKDDLIERLWGDTFVEDANLTQTVYLLRKTLGSNGDVKPIIVTVPKRGYKFVADVRIVRAENGPDSAVGEPTLLAPDSGPSATTSLHNESPLDEPVEESDGKHDEINWNRFWVISSVATILLALGIYGLLSGSSTATSETIGSIAVMPFNVIGSEDEFIGMGIADTLITRLGRTGKIAVRSTDETRYVTNNSNDPVEVGSRLRVDAVLTGNVQRIDERYRLNVQLIAVKNGIVMWSEHFDAQQSDIFSLQDSLTFRLVEALTINIQGAEKAGLATKTTDDAEAIRHYWRGRYFWRRRTPDAMRTAIDEFEKAIARDPGFALAYAGLADAYAVTSSGLAPAERFPKAKAAATRSLDLDDSLAEAHTSLAFVLYKSELNWGEAEKHFKRAIEINDSYATAHHWYGEFLVLIGRFDEGIDELRKAETIDQFSLAIKTDLAEGLYRARRFDEAIAHLGYAIRSYPEHPKFYQILKRVYKITGLSDEAVRADLQQRRAAGDAQIVEDVHVDAGSYWREQLRSLGPHGEATARLDAYFQLDDHESMLQMLEKGSESLDYLPLVLKVEPMFDSVRSDPRFEKLVRKANFP